MNSDFAWVLEDCLRRLDSGQSMQECLAAYPDQAEGLQPMLLVAGRIRAAPAPQPRPEAIHRGRERMLAAARANFARNSFVQPVSSAAFPRYSVRIFTSLKALLFGKETYGMKFALRLAIDLLLILIVGSVLTVNASARSLPGDPLYSVKRTWEEVRLNLALSDPARQQLQNQFQQYRLEEVREMIRMGRTGLVEFEGQLESISVDELVVNGLRVRMLPDTIVEGNPQVGRTVRVRALLQADGVLTALQVYVPTQFQQPDTYPAPMVTRTPMQTSMPSGTPWPTSRWEPTYGPTNQPWPTDDHHDDDDHNDCCGSSGWDGSGWDHSWP